ncbi:MAG: pyridoxal-phosphate dependent enzyme, partial [bacterium]|nr:pyridoxal-phosphate dependent enzyme [bacterium]
AAVLDKHEIQSRYRGIWDLSPLLPVRESINRLSLGEGNMPLIKANRLGHALGISQLFIKDESLNPTGSFKARGLCVAVSRARELGINNFSIPTAGNAGGALAAYSALSGLEAHIAMPADTPQPFIDECRLFNADVSLVNGVITD